MKFHPSRYKVGLELTSKCNLRCGMCPLPVLRRPYEEMAEEVVEKLLASPLKRLRICVDSINPKVYPQLRTGGDFDRLVELTRSFLAQANGHRIRIEIQKMRSRLTVDESIDDFRSLFDL